MLKYVKVLLVYDKPEVIPLLQNLVRASRKIHLEIRSKDALGPLPYADVILLNISCNSSKPDTLSDYLQHEIPDAPIILILDNSDNDLTPSFAEWGVEDILLLDQLTPAFLEYAVTAAFRLRQATNGLRQQKDQLLERVKELDCLYAVSKVTQHAHLSLDEIFQKVVEILPAGWLHSQHVWSRITYQDRVFQTPNYQPTPWLLKLPIMVENTTTGTVEVGYLHHQLASTDNAFLKAEQSLLVATAQHLGDVIQQHLAQEQLRQRNAQLDLIMMQVPAIIWITDLEMVLTSVAGNTRQLLGIENVGLVGTVVSDWFPVENAVEVLPAIAVHRAAIQGIPGTYTYQPAQTLFEVQVEPLKGADSTIIGTIAMAVDVTERESALALIRQQTQDRERLYEASQLLGATLELEAIFTRTHQLLWDSIGCERISIFLYDETSHQISCMDPHYSYHDLRPSEFPATAPNSADQIVQSMVLQTGRSLLISDYQSLVQINPENMTSSPLPQSALVVPIKQGNKVQGVVQILSNQPDAYTRNDLRFAEALILPIAAAIQNALLYEQAQRELAERKTMQLRLAESEHFARAILNALTSHIAVLDEQGVIIETNQAWNEFGQQNGLASPADCVGLNYLDACTWSEGENTQSAHLAQSMILSVLNGSREQLSLEYPCHSEDEQRWFLMRVTRFSDADPVRVVIAHDNITARKKMELELENATEHLLIINQVLSLASSSLEVKPILTGICEKLAALLNMSAAIAVFTDETGMEARLIAAYADKRSALPVPDTRFKVDDNEIYRQLAETQNLLVVPDCRTSAFKYDLMKQDQEIGSLIAVPLMAQQKMIGAICLISPTPQTFTEMQMALVTGIMNAISQAVENSFLHQTVSRQNSQLAETVEQRTAQLNRANGRMAAILDSTSDAIILIKPDGRIENTNSAFDHLFQREPDEFFGQPVFCLGEAAYQSPMRALFEEVSESTIPQRLEIKSRRKDGQMIDIDAAFSPIKYLDSSSRHMMVASFRDITHLKEIERLKDRFVSTVSHELRTPLTSLVLGANSLRQYYERITDAQRLEIINRVYEQSNVLAALVEDILHLSQLEARSQVPLTPINLAEVLDQVAQELEMRIGDKNLTLQLSVTEHQAIVPGINTDVVRIWRNLIDNAIKYTPAGGTIEARLGRMHHTAAEDTFTGINASAITLPANVPEGSYLLGQVEDSGRGIEPDDLKQLFTRFFRGRAAHSNISGTGLGLALVKELLVRYGGDICVSSQVDSGTIFSFWLPIRESR